MDTPVFGWRAVLNIVPIGLAAELAVQADVFISTWALNESADPAQRMVADGGWFGARHLLLGMHDGEWLLERAATGGARTEPVGDFVPGQNYAFR